ANLRNSGMRQPEQVDAVQELRHHSGAEQLDLPREQQVPDGMVLARERSPALRDHIILPAACRLVSGNRLLKHSWVSLRVGKKNPAELGAGGSEAAELSLRRESARSSLAAAIIARRRGRGGANDGKDRRTRHCGPAYFSFRLNDQWPGTGPVTCGFGHC